MIVLGLDTSTMTGGAALVSEHGLIGEYVLNIRTTHSERLLPAIARLLTDADLNLADLGGIAVVTGPGSFTGLRIGVATAKGFAYARGIPLVGVTLFQSFAWQHTHFPGLVCPLVDARRGEVYAQLFEGNEPISEPWNKSVQEVVALCALQGQKVLFVGDGAQSYASAIREKMPTAVFPSVESINLYVSSVASLGRQRIVAGAEDDPLLLAPFYLRKSEAELKWKANP